MNRSIASAVLACLVAASPACKKREKLQPEVVAPTMLAVEIEVALRWTRLPEAKHRTAALAILAQLATAPIDRVTRGRLIDRTRAMAVETDSNVVEGAFEVLRVVEPDDYIENVFEAATSGPAGSRRAAAAHLAKVATPALADRITKLLAASMTDPLLGDHRMLLVIAVEKAPHADATPHLTAALAIAKTDWDREKIAQVLAVCGASLAELVTASAYLTNDSQHPYGRVAIVMRLGARGDHSHTEFVVAHLDSQHESLRVAAVRALGQLRDPAAAPALLRRFGLVERGTNEARALEAVLRNFPKVRWNRAGPQVEASNATPPKPELIP